MQNQLRLEWVPVLRGNTSSSRIQQPQFDRTDRMTALTQCNAEFRSFDRLTTEFTAMLGNKTLCQDFALTLPGYSCLKIMTTI